MIGQKQVETGGESGLEAYGIRNIDAAYWNLGASALIEHAVQRREGHLSADGALVVRTGQYTGRSPKDKFLVRDELTEKNVQWGPVNQPITEAQFNRIYSKMQSFWQGHEVFVQDCFVGADRAYGLPVRVVSPIRLARLICPAVVHPPRAGRVEELRPQVHDSFRARISS